MIHADLMELFSLYCGKRRVKKRESDLLNEIKKTILLYAKDGDVFCDFDLGYKYRKEVITKVMTKLKKKGYQVLKSDNNDYLKIIWAKKKLRED